MGKEVKEHRKYYNKDGKIVPSCTTVVSILGKPELVQWANFMGFKRINTKKLLEEKADYGTYCHSIMETYFTGILTKSSYNPAFVSQSEYLEIIRKFDYLSEMFDRLGIVVLDMELPLEGDECGGTLDMLAYSKKLNKLFIFDLKTSKQLYRSHLIQLGGYTRLIKEIYGLDVTDVGIILLREDIGSKKFVNIISTENNKLNERIFNKLLDIYYLMNVDN